MTAIPFLPHRLHRSQFLRANPGPYFCRPGSDGVDDTYDVCCLATENHIVSTHYWDEEEDARRIAGVIAAALNHAAGHEIAEPDYPNDIAQFQREFPGPYSFRKGRCEGRGPCFDVFCRSTKQSIVDRYGSDRFDRQIAQHIVFALNQRVAVE